jgi:hypothetical protein
VPTAGRSPSCTVSKHAHAAPPGKNWWSGQKPRPNLLDRQEPYPAQRINEGCLKAGILGRELSAQGFTGSYPIVEKYVEPYRSRPDLT